MKFRTEIKIESYDFTINHKNKIATFGSCFADNIADKLRYFRFQILQNPFGVLYNPVSIANALKIAVNEKIFTEDDLIFYRDEYHSFYHHGSFSHHNLNVCLEKINETTLQTKNFLRKTDLAILTFGTAFVYKHIQKNIIVSNCHKIPQKEFERFRLTVNDAAIEIIRAIKYLKLLNENVRILLTVSPIRHWKDGACENQRSKSTLILAIDKVLHECSDVYYFPSYELVMDDLRDYRFYEDNLLHPNSFAVNYIWEKFSGVLFDNETTRLLNKIEKINKGLLHKPRNKESDEYKLFSEKLKNEISELTKKFPHINFETREILK